MTSTIVRPEDVLSEDQNSVILNGLAVRKGSIAAFLKNIDMLEEKDISQQQKADILQMIEELAPAVIAAGLHKHAVFHNKAVQEILDTIAKNL